MSKLKGSRLPLAIVVGAGGVFAIGKVLPKLMGRMMPRMMEGMMSQMMENERDTGKSPNP